ncbi:hypothetical protein CDAR_33671 [Caerostris darwini]|uniref:Uncharacterized protein n=1 Tax=Caerostris darwini TaxID=1538125 RepID=A0AAV4S1C7_9ARAC|nr:hypothetical protein CDAR_33671 [Caerostris darwini]
MPADPRKAFRQNNSHLSYGFRTLQKKECMEEQKVLALSHHEEWEGRGRQKKIALAADGFSSSGGKLINNLESEGLASRDTQNNSFKGSFPSLIPD